MGSGQESYGIVRAKGPAGPSLPPWVNSSSLRHELVLVVQLVLRRSCTRAVLSVSRNLILVYMRNRYGDRK